jgi:hypothetical protein
MVLKLTDCYIDRIALKIIDYTMGTRMSISNIQKTSVTEEMPIKSNFNVSVPCNIFCYPVMFVFVV